MLQVIDVCVELESVAARLYNSFRTAPFSNEEATAAFDRLVAEKRERIEQFRIVRGGFEAGLVPSALPSPDITLSRLKWKLDQVYALAKETPAGLDAAVAMALRAEAMLMDQDSLRILKLNDLYGLEKSKEDSGVPALTALRRLGDTVGRTLAAFAETLVDLYDARQKLWEREDQDPVTGARARKVLFQHGRFLLDWAVRYDRPVGLLLVRVDDSASLVGQFGHAFYDSALAAVSNRLRTVCRRTDWIMRNGPDNFAVLVLGTPRTGLRVLAAKILQQMSSTRFLVSGKSFPLTASIGLCCYPAPGLEEPSVELMLQLAERALAKAHEVGGNCCIESEPGQPEEGS